MPIDIDTGDKATLDNSEEKEWDKDVTEDRWQENLPFIESSYLRYEGDKNLMNYVHKPWLTANLRGFDLTKESLHKLSKRSPLSLRKIVLPAGVCHEMLETMWKPLYNLNELTLAVPDRVGDMDTWLRSLPPNVRMLDMCGRGKEVPPGNWVWYGTGLSLFLRQVRRSDLNEIKKLAIRITAIRISDCPDLPPEEIKEFIDTEELRYLRGAVVGDGMSWETTIATIDALEQHKRICELQMGEKHRRMVIPVDAVANIARKTRRLWCLWIYSTLECSRQLLNKLLTYQDSMGREINFRRRIINLVVPQDVFQHLLKPPRGSPIQVRPMCFSR